MNISCCRSCNNSKLNLIIDLGMHAWCNNFLSLKECGYESVYPLRLVYCNKCSLAQIDYTVPKEIMFSNHAYVSGTNQTLSNHFYKVAENITKKYNIEKKDLIVDIGGNDGTQLQQYKKLGYNNLLNIESAHNIAKIARQNQINTDIAFFNKEYVKQKLLNNFQKAKIINASGVFFHLEELHSVIEGIYELLDKDGIFIVQFMYFLDMLKKGTFDGIYHEHLCYYTLTSLKNLLEKYKLYLIDAHHSSIHGGSIIAYFSKKLSPLTSRVNCRLELEKQTININTFSKFVKKIHKTKNKLIDKILNYKDENSKIVGVGAPAKGNTLLTYCNLNYTIIDELLEINPLKIGLYTPVTHIPIVKQIIQPTGTTFLFLAWNFKKEIVSTQWLPYKRNIIYPFK